MITVWQYLSDYQEVNTAMLTPFELNETIERIRRMELYFDIIGFVLKVSPHAVLHDGHISAMLAELTAYYDGGQWLEDFQSDERGELPSGLKRGVLSEDGVYNLLCDIRELAEAE